MSETLKAMTDKGRQNYLKINWKYRTPAHEQGEINDENDQGGVGGNTGKPSCQEESSVSPCCKAGIREGTGEVQENPREEA